MDEISLQLSTIVTLATPTVVSLIWLVRLEGKVKLNQQRLEDQAHNLIVTQDMLKEMHKELQTVNSNVMWMRGRLQGKHNVLEQPQE